METMTLSAPAYWASYLINGDSSGLEPSDKTACDAWIESEGLGLPVDCDCDEFFAWRHDAFRFMPLGATCLDYTFII